MCRVGMHDINSLSAVTDLASLPHLAHLKLGSCVSTDQLGSSQRFMFPSLTCLEFVSVNASFLAAMDCPKLQHLGIDEDCEEEAYGLVVDSAPGLRACAEGIFQHCRYVHLTRKPGVTLTAALKALAPWQPSAAALSSRSEGMGLMLDGEKKISASHLELLPTGLQELSFMCCKLLPGALFPVATRFTQLRHLALAYGCSCVDEDLQRLASHAVQGDRLTVSLSTNVTAEFARALQRLSHSACLWGGGHGPKFDAFAISDSDA
ncbi:hypothetical protein V8C86DRAFT_3141332 [Haematococcus lacustris]